MIISVIKLAILLNIEFIIFLNVKEQINEH